MNTINENISVAEVVESCPNARRIFDRHGLKGCGGEHGPGESLSFFAAVHQVNVDELIRRSIARWKVRPLSLMSTKKPCRTTSTGASLKLAC